MIKETIPFKYQWKELASAHTPPPVAHSLHFHLSLLFAAKKSSTLHLELNGWEKVLYKISWYKDKWCRSRNITFELKKVESFCFVLENSHDLFIAGHNKEVSSSTEVTWNTSCIEVFEKLKHQLYNENRAI